MIYRETSRRAFLRGALGATLAIPLLPSLLPRAARAAPPPLRFFFLGALFGRDLDAWYPKQEPRFKTSPDGALYAKLSELGSPFSYILGSSFDGLRDKISILRGLDAMQIGDAHSPTVPLTGSGDTQTNGVGFGYSVDCVLEESDTFYDAPPMIGALRTCPNDVWKQLSFSYTSRSSPGETLWYEWNPKVLYDKYFNPATLDGNKKSAQQKRSIVNAVLEDFKEVSGSRKIAADDRRRLDNYMSLLADAERKLAVEPVACRQGVLAQSLGSAEDLHDAVFDLEVAALACGMTKIVCHAMLHYTSSTRNLDEPGHAEAHQQTPAKSDPSVTQHAIHNKWVMTRVAALLEKLDAVSESDGSSLLDNTLFLYGNTEARGFHSQLDMPVLLAGARGKLRTGYYIDYRPRPLVTVNEPLRIIAGRPYNHLLTSVFKLLGIPPTEYQRFDTQGFGIYDQFERKLSSHYAPFLKDRSATLPYLLV